MLEKENEKLNEEKRLLKEKVQSNSQENYQLDLKEMKNCIINKDKEIELLEKENGKLTDKIKEYQKNVQTLMADLKKNRELTNQNLIFLKKNVIKQIESKEVPLLERVFVEEFEIIPSNKEIISNEDNDDKSWYKTTRISEVHENDKNVFQIPDLLENDKSSSQNEITSKSIEQEKDRNNQPHVPSNNKYTLTKPSINSENTEKCKSNSDIKDHSNQISTEINCKFEFINFECKGKIVLNQISLKMSLIIYFLNWLHILKRNKIYYI
jgi:hypothetical protein